MELLPHSYTNRTARDGGVVIKAYQQRDAAVRCEREATVLAALARLLPVPPVLGRTGTTLRLGFMPGVPGQELIARGLAAPVLRACGEVLRRIQAVDLSRLRLVLPGRPAPTLVHGDFGPNNALLDPGADAVTAIVDWEWAHAGHPVEDLAWCEWIVRMHHPGEVAALGALFDGYAARPDWAERHQAMISRCQELVVMCERWAARDAGTAAEASMTGESVRLWRDRLRITESWRE
jgi:aminoglycoside phosphotransferase (APT) family kinase protein